MDRRKFLGFSVLATASALVNPPATFASVQRAKDEEEIIPTRILGKTGLKIPILSMGVMRADNPAVVRAAYKAGLTFFDTAHGYQNGKNEELLGAFFKDKDRSTFTIATKGKAHPDSEHFETEYEELLNTSLRRLQMDYVDIFYAHAIDDVEQVNHPRLVAMLKKFKEEGKIKHIGFSTHANKPGQIDAAIEAGIY
ncbi:MAG: aldo/keto reductase, partial [Dysgonamonadaceae bacterium]|nr:aldo/keto reductase [Dysgonamonadaceae bacterium]